MSQYITLFIDFYHTVKEVARINLLALSTTLVVNWWPDPDSHQSQNSGAIELKMDSSRAVDSYNGGIEVQNRAVEGSQILLTLLRNRIWIRIRIKWKMSDPDPHQSEKRVPDPDLQCCWKVNYLMCSRGSKKRTL